MNLFEAGRRFTQRMKPTTLWDEDRAYQQGQRSEPVKSEIRGTVHCRFDNGRALEPIPGEDGFRKLTRDEIDAGTKKDEMTMQ